MNISTDLDLLDKHIVDHPMKPFGIRYWRNWDNYYLRDINEYLEYYSPQACSWLRDQEYLVDFQYHEQFDYMHMISKVRYRVKNHLNLTLF